MKSARILIIFTFLLAFASQVSAQDEKPKIDWKNLQEKFEFGLKKSTLNQLVSYSPEFEVVEKDFRK